MACGSRWFHYWSGYLGSVEQRPVIKCFFKVWMTLSADSRKWICGGTIWWEIFRLSRVFLRISKASLSIIWSLGLCPEVVSVSRSFWTPLLMYAPDLDGRASSKMALLS